MITLVTLATTSIQQEGLCSTSPGSLAHNPPTICLYFPTRTWNLEGSVRQRHGRRPTENRRHGTGHGSHPASHSARHLGMGCFFPLSKLDTHSSCHPICIASRDLKPRGAPPSGDNSPDRQPGPSALLPPNADVDRHPLTECHYSLDKLSTPANLPRVVIVQNPPDAPSAAQGFPDYMPPTTSHEPDPVPDDQHHDAMIWYLLYPFRGYCLPLAPNPPPPPPPLFASLLLTLRLRSSKTELCNTTHTCLLQPTTNLAD